HSDQALRIGDDHPDLMLAAQALKGWAALSQGRLAVATACVEAARTLADTLGDQLLLPRLDIFGPLAWVELHLGRIAEAERHIARARGIAESIGHSSALPYLLVVAAHVKTRQGRLDAALCLAEEAADAARSMGSTEIADMAEAARVRALLWRRGPAEAIAAAEALSTAGRPRSAAWARIGQLDHALAQAVAGDAAMCQLLLKDCTPEWPQDPHTVVTRLALQAAASSQTGDHDVATGHASAARQAAEEAGLPYERGLAAYAAAYVAS